MVETYWDIFIKSGSIEDYLSFCAHRPDLQNRTSKENENDIQRKRADSQRTEYR